MIDDMEEVKALELLLIEKDKKIATLEQRVDELEQYTRRENLVISGLETCDRSYAAVIVNTDLTEDAPEEQETLEQQVISFLRSKNMNVHN